MVRQRPSSDGPWPETWHRLGVQRRANGFPSPRRSLGRTNSTALCDSISLTNALNSPWPALAWSLFCVISGGTLGINFTQQRTHTRATRLTAQAYRPAEGPPPTRPSGWLLHSPLTVGVIERKRQYSFSSRTHTDKVGC